MRIRSCFPRGLALLAALLLAACGGSGVKSDPTNPPASAAPTVSLAASAFASGSSTLTWSSTDATSCTASGAWSGTQATSGSLSVSPAATSSYTLECTGAGGSDSQSVTVTVPAPPATAVPTVTLTANPTSIASGATSTLTWSSTDATSCTASGAWSGTKATSGTFITAALSAAATYTLSCTGTGGSASRSVTVTVSSSTNPPPTADSASKVGPYTVLTYTSGISVPGGSRYKIPKIWYPQEPAGPYPGVIFVPGHNSSYTEPPYTVVINGVTVVEADITQWGVFFASHGFAVMFIDTVDYGANPPDRATALLQAVAALAAESTRTASPLFGKLDPSNIAVMGHSFGASGALYAANGNTEARIKAAVALSPIPQPSNALYPNVVVPSIIVGGVNDPFQTSASMYQDEYDSIPNSTSKLLAEFKESAEFDSMHAIALTPLGTHSTDPVVARLGLSFVEVYLMGDQRYQQFLVTDPSIHAFSYNP